MLILTMGWVQQSRLPIQVSNKEHTTNFCWTNGSGNGKYLVGVLEGEGALLGCRYVKSKQEIIKNVLPFSYKITQKSLKTSTIGLTPQSMCRTESA